MEDVEANRHVLKDVSIPVEQAYGRMLALVVPLLVALVAVYVAVWGWEALVQGFRQFTRWTSLIPALIVGVPLHEVIHGLAWAAFGRKPLKAVKFGFQVKTLTPYAHLPLPIRAGAYRWGAAMPALVLGLLPCLIGLGTGLGWFAMFGLFYLLAAGGDLVVLWVMRSLPASALVEDHPSRAGCLVVAE
jgi:hypothetical protein